MEEINNQILENSKKTIELLNYLNGKLEEINEQLNQIMIENLNSPID